MAFCEPEQIEDEETIETMKSSKENKCWGFLPILNPVQIKIGICLSKEDANNLVELMYGTLPEGTDNTLILDAIGELTNTIAGNFMNKLDNDKDFELGLPETGVSTEEKFDSFISIPMQIDDIKLSVLLANYQG